MMCGWQGGEEGKEEAAGNYSPWTVEELHFETAVHSQLPHLSPPPPTLASTPPFSHERIIKTWNSGLENLASYGNKSHSNMKRNFERPALCSRCCGAFTRESTFPVSALLLEFCQEKHPRLQWLLFNLWCEQLFIHIIKYMCMVSKMLFCILKSIEKMWRQPNMFT